MINNIFKGCTLMISIALPPRLGLKKLYFLADKCLKSYESKVTNLLITCFMRLLTFLMEICFYNVNKFVYGNSVRFLRPWNGYFLIYLKCILLNSKCWGHYNGQ